MREKILIKGAGEMASAAAHRLFKCGFPVVMTDIAQPTAVRRNVCFCDSIYNSAVTVEGVTAVSYSLDRHEFLSDFDFSHIPVFVDADCSLSKLWQPEIIVDGRMLKKNLGNCISDARLVIGLGPGLEAGKDVHFVVETNRGHRLGRIIDTGKAEGNTGVPGNIGGYTHERVLKSPAGGQFCSDQEIGNHVRSGDLIGVIGSIELRAKIAGVIRGLIKPGIQVLSGEKIADIDPRADANFCNLISDKARNISGSVLELVVAYVNRKNN